MWQSLYVVALATVCLCQHQQSTNGDRQVRLEDIERDNLAATQKASTATPSQPAQQHQPSVTQQQLAAYQQQLLLQQLQQQYFAPTPLTYTNLGGVPLMIIPGNHLGVGNSAGLPIQAFFVPADPYYQHQVYQSFSPQSVAPRIQPTHRLQQDLSYRQPQNYPSASVVYAGTPTSSAYQQAQSYRPQQQQLYSSPQQQLYSNTQQATQQHLYSNPQQTTQKQLYRNPQQTTQQQLYNAYNALYLQQQEKNSFAAGVKSTPAPPLKTPSTVYSPQSSSGQAYSNYKNFNYNQ